MLNALDEFLISVIGFMGIFVIGLTGVYGIFRYADFVQNKNKDQD